MDQKKSLLISYNKKNINIFLNKMEKHILLEKSPNQNEFIGNKIEDFEILQSIGENSFGFISKVKSKLNQKIYIIKMIDFSKIKEKKEKQLSKNEIENINKLDSPHIIKCYGHFIEGDRYYIIMEYFNNGDLRRYIDAYKNMKKPIPEEELWKLIYQCMSGLAYIHKNHIAHRNIKPLNIYLTDKKAIKIGNFALSVNKKNKIIDAQNLMKISIESRDILMKEQKSFLSPEIYNQQNYSYKVDVYSMGMIFYEMCFFSVLGEQKMLPNGEIINDKQNENVYSQDLVNLINMMIEEDQFKRPSSFQILELIKKRFKFQNSSIGCSLRCLFTYKNMIEYLKSYIPNYKSNQIRIQKPISFSILYAFDKDKKNNYNKILNELREVLTFNNPFFEEIDEIEPKDLIDFWLKKIHIENNKIACPYSRIYTKENDIDLFDRKKMLEKYAYNFKSYFKSYITDKFFGTKEIIKTCLECNKPRYYIESFYYLKFDANEVNKYFSNSNNFILDILKKESQNYVQIELFCPHCKKKSMHREIKKIMAISFNLIISLEREEINFNNQNLKYPLSLNLDNFGVGIYNLKGVIKKSIVGQKKYFVCIYKVMNQWLISDGIKIESLKCSSPLNHKIGNIIMLFYSNEN